MRSSWLLVACAAPLLALSGAVNCALPEPVLRGVRNGSTVALPAAVEITSAYPLASGIFTTALHNGRVVEWNTVIEIDRPGTHRFVAVAVTSDRACERADVFVFDTIDSDRPSVVNPASLKSCSAPEVHFVIFWASIERELVPRLAQVLSALSAVTSYHDAEYHIALRRLLRVEVDPKDPLDEAWLSSFYGDTHATLSDDPFVNRDFQYSGSFSVAIVEDLCPVYAFDLDCKQHASLNMMRLRSLLHDLNTRDVQVHVPLTRQESWNGFDRLFGISGERFLAGRNPSPPSSTEFEKGLLAKLWDRVLVPMDAAVMLTAFIQTEWHHFQTDVPSLHAELGARILDLEVQSTMDTIHRAAFLGAIHIALIAHIPADTKWYSGVVDLHHLASFRVINENSWQRGSFQCLTIREAAARMGNFQGGDCSPNCTVPLQSQLSHGARVHQLEAFADRLLEKPLIAVSARLAGPFTILDGNHRAITLTRAQPPTTRVPVFIGISSKFDAPHEGSFYCP